MFYLPVFLAIRSILERQKLYASVQDCGGFISPVRFFVFQKRIRNSVALNL